MIKDRMELSVPNISSDASSDGSPSGENELRMLVSTPCLISRVLGYIFLIFSKSGYLFLISRLLF